VSIRRNSCAAFGRPDAGAERGWLSATNPVAEGLAAYSKMLETLDGCWAGARTAVQWVGFGRVDWKAAERHRFTLEGIGATWDSPGGGLTRVSESYGPIVFGRARPARSGCWTVGGISDSESAGGEPGIDGRNVLSTQRRGRRGLSRRFSVRICGAVTADQCGQSIRIHDRRSRAVRAGSYPDERLFEGRRAGLGRGSVLVKAGFDLMHNSDATNCCAMRRNLLLRQRGELCSDALVYGAFGSLEC